MIIQGFLQYAVCLENRALYLGASFVITSGVWHSVTGCHIGFKFHAWMNSLSYQSILLNLFPSNLCEWYSYSYLWTSKFQQKQLQTTQYFCYAATFIPKGKFYGFKSGAPSCTCNISKVLMGINASGIRNMYSLETSYKGVLSLKLRTCLALALEPWNFHRSIYAKYSSSQYFRASPRIVF